MSEVEEWQLGSEAVSEVALNRCSEQSTTTAAYSTYLRATTTSGKSSQYTNARVSHSTMETRPSLMGPTETNASGQKVSHRDTIATIIGAWQRKTQRFSSDEQTQVAANSVSPRLPRSSTLTAELLQTLTGDAARQAKKPRRRYFPCCTRRNHVIQYSKHHLIVPQISNYDAAALLPITSVIYMFTSGSTLRTPTMLFNLITVLAVSFLFVTMLLLIEPTTISAKAYNDLRHVTSSLTNWSAFLLGPLLGVMLSRWWALRINCLGGLWGCCDDIMLLIGCQCDQEEHAFIRQQMHKWITASWLLCQFSFTDVNDEDALEVLNNSATITSNERELLAGQPSKPQIIWCWVMRMIRALADKGVINSLDKQVFQEMVLKARGSIGYLYAHFDTPVLFAFVHLMTLLVHATSILQSACSAFTIADYISDQIMEGQTDNAAVGSSTIFLLIQFLVFQGLLTLAEMLKNPFSPMSWGLPLMDFHKVFSRESMAFVEASYRVQNQMNTVHDQDMFWHKLTKLKHKPICETRPYHHFQDNTLRENENIWTKDLFI